MNQPKTMLFVIAGLMAVIFVVLSTLNTNVADQRVPEGPRPWPTAQATNLADSVSYCCNTLGKWLSLISKVDSLDTLYSISESPNKAALIYNTGDKSTDQRVSGESHLKLLTKTGELFDFGAELFASWSPDGEFLMVANGTYFWVYEMDSRTLLISQDGFPEWDINGKLISHSYRAHNELLVFNPEENEISYISFPELEYISEFKSSPSSDLILIVGSADGEYSLFLLESNNFQQTKLIDIDEAKHNLSICWTVKADIVEYFYDGAVYSLDLVTLESTLIGTDLNDSSCH